jgi:hypothetical protein
MDLTTLDPTDPNLFSYIAKASQEEDWPVKLQLFPDDKTDYQPLNMVNHYHPVSVKPADFQKVYRFIKKHNLKVGYEVATAFGISGLAAALAFKETGGKLLSIDCYVEEQHNSAGAYYHNVVHYPDSDGYKSATTLAKKFGVEANAEFRCGFSPNDVEGLVKEVFGDQKVQYVFIDALHNEPAMINDTNAILPFLDGKYAIFYHDVHVCQGLTRAYIRNTFGRELVELPECVGPMGYGVGLVTNLE